MKNPLLQLFASVLILGSASLAHATSAVAIYPQEGNTTCNNIALNTLIKNISVSRPRVTETSVIIYGEDASTVKYTNTGTTVGFQESNKPINFALLKSSAGAMLFIYPSGVHADDQMEVKINNVLQPITGITLCFGMTDTLPPVQKPSTIKSCIMSTILDETGIVCDPAAKRSLVCNFELDEPFYGLVDGSDSCCVCNSPELTECFPDRPAGVEGSCINPESKVLPTEVTTHIELNNDPYYCTTSGGIRKCYAY